MASMLVGLLACAYSIFGFGTQYVWARNYNSGDGVFVHWLVCVAIFLVGVALNFLNGLPRFQPLAMLGGCAFACGNIAAVPLINTLGVGMATLLWGTANCLVGWAVGNFGFFGILQEPDTSDTNPLLNYLGVIGVLAGGIFFAMVNTTESSSPKRGKKEEDIQLHSVGRPNRLNCGSAAKQHVATLGIRITVNNETTDDGGSSMNGTISAMDIKKDSAFDKRKIIGILGCVLAGCCYGVNFIPVLYIQENPHLFKQPPAAGIAFAHSHFTGALLASTLFFLVYCVYHKNRPFINPRLVLPSMVAGLLWGTAQLGWFIANDNLSQAISFPIIGTMPGVCAAMWSVFYFREIKGRRDLTLLAVAIALTCGGAALVGMSKSVAAEE